MIYILHVHTLNCDAFLQKLNSLLFTYINLRRIFAEMRRNLMCVNNKEKDGRSGRGLKIRLELLPRKKRNETQ